MKNMRHAFKNLWFGIREPFKKTNYIFLVSFFIFFVLFVLIPVWTVTGNTLATQLDIFTTRDYVVLILLSSLSSLFITMQVYLMRQKTCLPAGREKMGGVSTATAGGLGALFAGIAGTAGTAFCASCLAPFFALFGIGFGGVIFVLEYRFYFVAGIMLLMFIAIY
ncbi:hypothetical protein HY604_04355, partial [Candidatus Peregrinibacteria bacterium]|nr:hypothetical protein [Candidatus Peregrinibacteria bacterium]